MIYIYIYKKQLNPRHEKNKGMHRIRKVDEKSCVTPVGTSNKTDVQNKWHENTATHTGYLQFTEKTV